MVLLFVLFCLVPIGNALTTYDCNMGTNCNQEFIFPETFSDESVIINCRNAGECDSLIVYSSITTLHINCLGTNSCNGSQVYCGNFDPPGTRYSASDMDKTGISCDIECESNIAPGCINTLLSCKGNGINQCRMLSLNTDNNIASSTLECNMGATGGIGCQMDCYDYKCISSNLWCHGSEGSPLCYCHSGSNCNDVTVTNGVTYTTTTDNPTTDMPSSINPTTDNPTTNRPTTAVPTTFDPTTGIPTTNKPSTAIPSTLNPTTAIPTTSNPTTNNPTTGIPSTFNPSTAIPTTSNPTTDNPTTGIPSTNNAMNTKGNEPTLRVTTENKPTKENGNEVIETTEDGTNNTNIHHEESQNGVFDDYLWLLSLGITVLLIIIIVICIWIRKRKQTIKQNIAANVEIIDRNTGKSIDIALTEGNNTTKQGKMEKVDSDFNDESASDDIDGLFTVTTQQHITAGADDDLYDENDNITKGGEIDDDDDNNNNNERSDDSDNMMDEMYMKQQNVKTKGNDI